MKYFIIAGEASGDMHAANLVKALKKVDSDAEMVGWGGDRMANEGVFLYKHIRDLAFMGFVEVAMNIRTILGNMRDCKSQIAKFEPDALILVDYPGFNMRIAKWARKNKIKNIFYYIAPQAWAWKAGRSHQLRENVDHLFEILPFEPKFFNQYDVKNTYVGHPLLDEVKNWQPNLNFRTEQGIKDHQKIIALLPGSRHQEIKRHLPIFLEIVHKYPDYSFYIAISPNIDESDYNEIIGPRPKNLHYLKNKNYDLLHEAEACLVSSGTATLETALLDCPMVVCYKGGQLTYAIAKQLVNLKYISLVNLIMDQELVPELIQNEFNTASLQENFERILGDAGQKQQESFQELKQILGQTSGASATTAKLIFEMTDRRRRTHDLNG